MKCFGASLLILGTAGQSLAITFGPTVTVDGNSYTVGGPAGANGISVQQVGTTLAFALPNGVAVGTNKSMLLEYSVFADPGFYLSSVSQNAGNGIASGSANVGISTSFFGATNETAPSINYPAGSTFPTFSYSFTSAPSQWSPVKTTIDLNGTGGIAKVSTYNANYHQSPVPEPVSIVVLASGLGAMLVRRKGAK
ncbi:MAG: PEP-CTERM sorting domain-containing protein [Armatimonadota bacterium]